MTPPREDESAAQHHLLVGHTTPWSFLLTGAIPL